MRKRLIGTVLCVALLLGGAAMAETAAPSGGEIEVQGQAVRTVAPDTVTINIGTKAEDKSEKVAQEQANRVIGDVIEALRVLSVEDTQMHTSGYNITRKYDYRGSRSILSGYVCSISLRVTVQDFELINQILDVAVEKGANDVGNITFSHSDEGAVYRQALADAIRAAMTKAEVMAETAGVRLGTLKTLREGSSGGAYVNAYAPMMERATEAETGGGTQIMSGEIEVSAYVSLVYETR